MICDTDVPVNKIEKKLRLYQPILVVSAFDCVCSGWHWSVWF